MISSPKKIEIKIVTGKGRGVFATELIQSGEIIEVCPVLELPTIPEFDDHLLDDYRFKFGEENYKFVLSLGYGSLYNHNDDNNASWRNLYDINAIEFYSLRNIRPGEEICIRYTKDPNDWFRNRPHIIKI